MKPMQNTLGTSRWHNPVARAALMACGLALSFHVLSDSSGHLSSEEQAMVREALSAAPPQVAATATVIDLEGKVLKKGDGAYTCLPGPPGFAGPMCHDEQFMKWMQALMNGDEKPPVTTMGTSYMLAGDSPDGGASNIDPAAKEPTKDNEWVVEGPHIMVIVPDAELLSQLPTTTDTEGPYVMWPDSPYAHIMWPVAERPEQRTVSRP